MLEHKLIEQINKLCPNRSKDLLLSIGDDAAVFTTEHFGDKYLVACQDLLIEDVHFKLNTHSAEDLGYKSLAVNFSDIAAMGATPLFVMISIALPKHLTESTWIESFYKGANILCEQYSATIMGGDLSSSPTQLFIDVSVIGVCFDKPILRSGIKLGDLIGVTGHLGLSHTGLRVLSQSQSQSQSQKIESKSFINATDFSKAIGCHLRPQPRIEQARKLAPYIHSLMDISDGLVNDLSIMLNQSSKLTNLHLGANLNFEQTPFLHSETIDFCQKQNKLLALVNYPNKTNNQSKKLNPIDFALYGGEDFELLFSFAPNKLEDIEKALNGTQWYIIGSVTDKEQITYRQHNKDHTVDMQKRWSHF